jgi:hypothetical protein
MKKLFLIVTIVFMTTAISNVFGQTAREVKLSANKQTVDAGSKLTFKLIKVEDSRCPTDVDCIWAGNAVVKFSIAKGKSAAKIFELDSAETSKKITFEGYEIALKDLSPIRKTTDTSPINYIVKLTMTKMPKGK